MPVRLILLLACSVLAPVVAAADDDCPKHFKDYGFFLQAKASCGKKVEYPLMKTMKACAKQTPQAAAMTWMDDGRRVWARGLMRSNLGSMCEDAFSKPSASSEGLQRR